MKKFILLTLFFSASIIIGQTYQMSVNKTDGTTQIYQITDINSISFSGIPSAIDAEKMTNVIKTFQVLQNYPNPFNPSTVIEYNLPKAGTSNVNIFDVNGKLIRSLHSGVLDAGNHRITWDSKNDAGNIVTSGVYFYQIQFEKSLITKKMLFIK